MFFPCEKNEPNNLRKNTIYLMRQADLRLLNETNRDNTVGDLDVMSFSQLVETLVLNNRRGVLYYQMTHEFGQNAATQLIKAILTGSELLEMTLADSEGAGQMMKPPRALAESVFQESKELEHCGYMVDTGYSQPECYYSIHGFQLILSVLGVTTGFKSYDKSEKPDPMEVPPGPNRCIGHTIQMPGRNFRGKTGPRVQSRFYQTVNVKDGLIMAIDNFSPLAAYEGIGIPPNALPPVRSWSDVAFLQWKLYAGKDDPLRFVLRYNVVNPATKAVVSMINHTHKTGLMPWPGTCYAASSDEGTALLGTPNGIGVAYLLIQHKHYLGHKTVDSVTVFEHNEELMLLFTIVDVRQDDAKVEATAQSHARHDCSDELLEDVSHAPSEEILEDTGDGTALPHW